MPHATAQRPQQPGELHADVAAADHRHAARQGTQGEHVVRHQSQLESGKRQPARSPAGRDHHVRRVPARAAVVLDEVRRQQTAGPAHTAHAGLGQAQLVTAGDAVDVVLASQAEAVPFQLAGRQVEAVVTRQRLCMRQLGRRPERLLRYAAAMHAGTARRRRVQHHHARAMLGRPQRRGQAARARPEHDQIARLLHLVLRRSRKAGCSHRLHRMTPRSSASLRDERLRM